MNGCVTARELDRFHAGELSADDSDSVRSHLQTCKTCASLDQELVCANERLMPNLHALQQAGPVLQRAAAASPEAVTSDPQAADNGTVTIPEIPGYEILREIHRGGQGVVFEAYQSSTKRKVAVKIMLAGRFASRAAQKRFDREIEIVAQLKHGNIISIFHSGTLPDGLRFYVMDYVRGRRLDHHVRDKRLTLEQTLALFSVICETVQYAHQRGVIHRDLKPSNIMIDGEGRPRVLDFGLAKILASPEDTAVSMSAEVLGTLPYMSPEQARGNSDEIDTRTDIYALGVMLYELLTGCYPYPVAGHVAEILRNITDTPPTPPARKWDSASGVSGGTPRKSRSSRCPIDDEVQTIVLKALAKERDRRYQSAGELARDLRHYIAGEAIEAKRDSGWYVLRKNISRHRGKLGAAAAFVVLLLSFGTYAQSVSWERQKQFQVKAMLDDVRDLYSHRLFSEAVRKCDQAMVLAPNNYDVMLMKAYSLKGEYFEYDYDVRSPTVLAEAESLAREAIGLRPEKWGHLNLLSTLLFSQNRLEDAAAAAQQAIDNNPDYHYAWSNLAKVRALQGRYEDSRDTFEQGLVSYERRVKKEGLRARHDDGIWRSYGTLLVFLGDDKALDILKRATEIDTSDYRSHWLLAYAHLTLGGDGHIAAAREQIAFGMDEFLSESAEPRFNRIAALAALRDGQFDRAEDHAKAAILGGDRPAYGHLILALAHAHRGDNEALAAEIEAARNNWPEFNDDGVFVEAEKGLLWFDRASDLDGLLEEAAELRKVNE